MLLPARPLRLTPSYLWKHWLGGIAIVLVGLGFGIGFGRMQFDAARDILAQSHVWQLGIPAFGAEVDGKVTTRKFVFNSYEFDVKFIDHQGRERATRIEFDTIFSTIDRSKDPEVRYLEGDPPRFALSWAVELEANRWVTVLIYALVGVGLLGVFFVCLGWVVLRNVVNAGRCAHSSDEVLLAVTKVKALVVNGQHQNDEYHYEGRSPDGASFKGKVALPKAIGPLWADDARRTMVALLSQESPARPLVVRADFYPLDLSPDERDRVRREIARRTAARRE